MIDELKPCPFCGGPAESILSGGEILVRCAQEDSDICPTRPGEYDDFWECTAAQWNTRPVEDALRAENTTLRLRIQLWVDEKSEEITA